MRKPKVGETLFLVDVGNQARFDGGKRRDCLVSKVGRKYFYVKETADTWREIQFYIEGWTEKTDCCIDYCIYENRQAWDDEKKVSAYIRAFKKVFYYGRENKFNLYQLQKAANILGIKIESTK